jgi:hypothetical protein
MGAIVIRTRYDEGTESAEVATSVTKTCRRVQRSIRGDCLVCEAWGVRFKAVDLRTW